jgi:hypothetical protein
MVHGSEAWPGVREGKRKQNRWGLCKGDLSAHHC